MEINSEYNIVIGNVISNKDNDGAGRLKVRTPNDNKISTFKDLPWAFPLLPKLLHIIPQEGESVFVFVPKKEEVTNSDRFWIGPLIPQLNKLEHSESNFVAKSALNESLIDLDPNPNLNEKSKGVYPSINDVGLLGKENTDVLLKDNEVWIRAGKYVKNGDLEVFNESPTYLQLRNKERVDNDGKTYNTTAVMVADKIALLSTQSKDKFDLSNKTNLLSDDEINRIIEKAHALPYGDVLLDFLNIVVTVAATHVHPYPGLPPCLDTNMKRLVNFNKNDILSETIKIN